MACPACLRNIPKTAMAGLFTSLVVFVLSVVLLDPAGSIFTLILKENLVVAPGNRMFESWSGQAPVPILSSIYLFNVTNADDVAFRGAKPHLTQMGPYVFHEFHTKTKLKWNDNGTVTYQQVRTYHFQPLLSNGSLSDRLITLNAPAASANAIALKMGGTSREFFDIELNKMGETMFVETTVKKLIFDGYKDPLLDFSKAFKPDTPDKFAYYYQRNGSDYFDGVFNMHTGSIKLHQLGQIATWNYTSHLPFYNGTCGKVQGGADLFPPGLNEDYVDLFISDLCRTVKLDFNSSKIFHRVDVNKYHIGTSLFANSSVNPANKCFESEDEVPSGVFDASTCRQGAPVFISQPHFYQADSYYLNQLANGSLSPNGTNHETYFLIEPKSGLPVNVAVRFQINFRIRNIGSMRLFQNLPEEDLFFPTVWFESKVVLPDKTLSQVWMLSNLSLFFTVIGCVLLGVTVVSIMMTWWCYKTRQPQFQELVYDDDVSEEEEHVEEEEEEQHSDEPAADTSS